ncbi:MAG: hypothetical protein ACWA44_04445 [Thiotrichales bacterium]
MSNLRMTKHAQCRAQQRGIRDTDIFIVLQAATQVAHDAYMLTRADAAREIARRKREIQQLERLSGKKIILNGNHVITCYHAHEEEQKRTLKKQREFQ